MIYDFTPEERMEITDVVLLPPSQRMRLSNVSIVALATCVAADEIVATGIRIVVERRGRFRTDFSKTALRYRHTRKAVRGERRRAAFFWILRSLHALAIDESRRPAWMSAEIERAEWLL